MSKIIRMTLDPQSIDGAIRELSVYNEQLEQKLETLKTRVAEEIGILAEVLSAGAVADIYWPKGDSGNVIQDTANVIVSLDDNGNTKLVIMSGEDAVWIEFGTGVWYNGAAGGSPHPKGTELNMTIGGYGKGYGGHKKWAFTDGSQTYFTRGIPAVMPLYNACMQTRNRIAEIAREVFAS